MLEVPASVKALVIITWDIGYGRLIKHLLIDDTEATRREKERIHAVPYEDKIEFAKFLEGEVSVVSGAKAYKMHVHGGLSSRPLYC